MKTTTLASMAFAALTQVLSVTASDTPLQIPSAVPTPGSPSVYGCYSDIGNMTKYTMKWPASGACHDKCEPKGKPVFALHGDECWCGDAFPAEDWVAKDSKCAVPCATWKTEACGGADGYYSVWNTGISIDIPVQDSDKDDKDDKDDKNKDDDDSKTKTKSTSASSTGDSKPAQTSAAQDTTPTPTKESHKDDGPNVAAIAGGVVAAVVGVAAIIGGVFFWLRRKRNAELEEDHRRNAAVNAFINGSKPPSSSGSISMTDSRLDPVMAHRRLSDGSIADNQDYSRRILRVTNA